MSIYLDPCTGTGNFIVNLMRRIPKKDLPDLPEAAIRQRSYATCRITSPLNIEHAYYELTENYESFEGLCFVDTLDMDETKQGIFNFMSEANTVRVEKQKCIPITVILGNPPYNMGQQNENDNNKNRKYKVVDDWIKETYAKDSMATLKTKLYDAYVKFFRWATNRLAGRDGIVCFISNNSFVDQIAFDGMRKHFLNDFTCIYHVDLHGNVRHNPKLSGTAHNVFGIQVGVGITIAVKSDRHTNHSLYYHRVPEFWRKEEKLHWLSKTKSINRVQWQEIYPDGQNNWFPPEHSESFRSLLPIAIKGIKANDRADPKSMFKLCSPGINTARDSFVYSFIRSNIAEIVGRLCDDYNSQVDKYKRAEQGKNIDDFVSYESIKWSSTLKAHLIRGKYAAFDPNKIRAALYRPYNKRYIFYDDVLIDRPGLFREILPNDASEKENQIICCSGTASNKPFNAIITSWLPSFDLVEKTPCFPFYLYDRDGTNRHENITDWALKHFRGYYGDKKITKWDIFYYVYGVLHHPGYRERFAENLKRELPRIPLAADFKAFFKAGKKLSQLHLDYEKLEPWPLEWIEPPDVPLSYRVEDKMRLTKDKISLKVNDSLTLSGIPTDVFRYRLGNRSALDWVIDQYQVSEDNRSGIRSDPNQSDDPEYIVRLVGQVIRVSIETVKIIDAMPTELI